MPFPWVKKLNRLVVGSASSSTDVKCAVISPNIDGSIRFDHNKDFAFCVGIDQQLTDRTEQVDETINRDATEMQRTFLTTLGLNPEQIKVSTASNACDDCTKKGLRDSFIKCAGKVKENGNFIFYFAGHGYELHDRCILSPADFNKQDVSSGISGDDLINWVNIAECKASNVLFIFDCCYAGNLGELLTSDENLKTKANLYVMCGCAPKEKVTAISALRHSIFTYFLLDYLQALTCRGEINVRQAMEIISDLCFSFSCLIMIYDGKLYCCTFTPALFIKQEGLYTEKAIVTLLKGFINDETEWLLTPTSRWHYITF